MKKIITLLIFIIFTSTYSQQKNELNNGYTEIFSNDSLNRIDIYNKLKEWISLNYKSSNDVIQLDTEEKIITKGNFIFNVNSGKNSFSFRVLNTLVFSIKDNKYKVDLTPTEMFSVDYPSIKPPEESLKIYISDEVMNKDEFIKYSLNFMKKTYADMGINEAKAEKMLAKDVNINNYMDEGYIAYLDARKNINNEINRIYTSIKDNVSKKDEW